MRWRANETTRMLLAVATPMVMMAPVSAGTLKVVPVSSSIQQMPASAAGSAVMMMKASTQDWKLTTIRRYTITTAITSPNAQFDEGGLHGLGLTADVDAHAARQVRPQLRHQAPDIDGNAAHVAALRAGKNVDRRRQVEARIDRLLHRGCDADQIAQQLRRRGRSRRWRRAPACAAARPDCRSHTAATARPGCTPPRWSDSAKRPARFAWCPPWTPAGRWSRRWGSNPIAAAACDPCGAPPSADRAAGECGYRPCRESFQSAS